MQYPACMDVRIIICGYDQMFGTLPHSQYTTGNYAAFPFPSWRSWQTTRPFSTGHSNGKNQFNAVSSAQQYILQTAVIGLELWN